MTIRWGILGAGKIAGRFAASLQNEKRSVLEAIAVRREEKALAFRERFSFERYYTDYEKLLEDEAVDAIYLALPHGLHKEWAIKAMRKGKAVLCEKPAALSAAEMREIAAVSRETRVLFMEAMKTRFVPLYPEIREIVQSGKIGKLTSIETTLCFLLPADMTSTYHTQKGQGGCLLDSGIYCAGWLEEFAGYPLKLDKVYAKVAQDVDMYVDARLSGQVCPARLETSFDRSKPKDAVLHGAKGDIHVYDLHRCQRADVTIGGKTVTLERPYEHDDFYGQIRHFVDLLESGRGESDIMSLEHSCRCAEILDVVRAGYTEYDRHDLEILEAEEELLQYESFTSKEALELGNHLVELLKEYDGELAIRITRESDHAVVFQYIMDSKSERNLGFIEGKQKVLELTGHSSLYAAIQAKVDGYLPERLSRENGCAAAGGAFPIRVNGQQVAVLAVSGLHEGKDHEIIVRALSDILGKETPCFYKAMV